MHGVQDKYCGDAVCTPAIRILEEMGVLQELVAHNEANFADSGGFVSPSGLSYIGALPSARQLALPAFDLPAGQGAPYLVQNTQAAMCSDNRSANCQSLA